MRVNIKQELAHLKLGDPRRSKRLEKIVMHLVSNPSCSINASGYNWADIKGAYRFFSNDKIKEAAIAESITLATRDRCLQNETVLCIQDTTNIAFDSSADGLGYLDHGRGTGVMSHNILAVDTQGCPLGLLNQDIWSRDKKEMGKAKERQQRDIADKESNRWLQGVKHCQELLADCKKIIHVGDREADIYELLSMPRAVNSELLIRATYDRKTLLGNPMWTELKREKVIAEFDLQVGNAVSGETKIARMSIRAGMLLLAPPDNKPDLPAIYVYGLLVREENAPPRKKPLEWRLISTEPVEHAQTAMQKVTWYSYRWRIERFHYVLKSGCRLEHLQLRSIAALRKAVLIYSLCAFKLMQLLYESKINPQQPCTNYLSPQECQVIFYYHHKVKLYQKQPLTLQKAVWFIAKMAGYIGRNNDGPPGIKNLWEGLKKLNTIMQFYQSDSPSYPQNSFG